MKRVLLLLVLGLACDRRPAREAHEEHAHDEKPAESHAHDEGDDHHDAEEHHAHGEEPREGAQVVTLSADALRDLRISTARAEVRPGGEIATALGELRVSDDHHAVVGAPLPARILKLVARPGDKVTRGAALAVASSAELGRARAEVVTAQARVRAAEKVLAREEELVGQGLSPQRQVVEARAALDAARVNAEAATASLAALGLGTGIPSDGDVGRFVLSAPISGVVVERPAVLGQMAHPDEVLFRIADLDTLWLVANVFERDAVRVRKGTPVAITLPAWPGERITAKVDFVGAAVDGALRTAPVRVVVDNSRGLLKPGMSASVVFTVGGGDQHEVVTVPTSALQRVDDAWCVFLPRGRGSFERREVARGRDLGGEVEILQGLTPGEEVVVEGSFVIRAESRREHLGGEHHHH
ncbi:MAG: efflux RND transporter periplasmic adaptor subunit [Myxococcota bacterium]